jgi:hypothetical protein
MRTPGAPRSRAGAQRIYLTPDLPHAARAAPPAGAFSASLALPADAEQSGLPVPHRIAQVNPHIRTLTPDPNSDPESHRPACTYARRTECVAAYACGPSLGVLAARAAKRERARYATLCLSTRADRRGRQHAPFA